MTVRCRYCKDEIVLNEDSEQTRKAKTDPSQQMRKHIEQRHLNMKEIAEVSRRNGWLFDRLFFECPTEPEKWRENVIRLVDAYLEGRI